MALIKIELDYPLEDGMSLTFKAPCDCTAVTGLKVYYPEITDNTSTTKSKTFSFRDAHLNALDGLGNLFEEGSTVKVIVDTVNDYAFIQNADTNGYIESKLQPIESSKAFRVYIQKTKWTGTSAPYTVTMNVPGVTEDWIPGVPVIDPGENDMETLMNEQKALSCLSQIVSAKDTLTFICYEKKPDHWMTIRIPGVVI